MGRNIITHGFGFGPPGLIITHGYGPFESGGPPPVTVTPPPGPHHTKFRWLNADGSEQLGALRFKQNEEFLWEILLEADGTPDDFTNALSVRLTVRKQGETPIINGSILTPVDAAAGRFQYDPTDQQTDVSGEFLAEVFATFVNGRRQRYPSPNGYAKIFITPKL